MTVDGSVCKSPSGALQNPQGRAEVQAPAHGSDLGLTGTHVGAWGGRDLGARSSGFGIRRHKGAMKRVRLLGLSFLRSLGLGCLS